MTISEVLKTGKMEFAVLLLLLCACYYTIVPLMVTQWLADDNYSHGFIVPLIAAFFLYERREELKVQPVRPWSPGLVVVVLGLAQLMIGFLGTEYFTMRSSLVVLLAGLVLYLFGKDIFRIVRLPILYLFLMIPLPYLIYDSIAFPLKLFVTRVSVAFLKLIGIVVLREGNIIMFPTTTLEVADACSGIRSLVSLIALAVAYAFFMRVSTTKRWLIIASAVPIAVFTNAMRVVVTGILAQYWGARAAEGFFHEFAGMAVFVMAMMILVAVGAFLKDRSENVDGQDPRR